MTDVIAGAVRGPDSSNMSTSSPVLSAGSWANSRNARVATLWITIVLG
jgi:hypothetical protein